MKKQRLRLPDGAAVILGLSLLLLAGLIAVCSPGGEFSDWERRYLAERPAAPDLLSWDTDKKVESFLADHIPLRTALVAVDSVAQTLTGRRTQLSAWYSGGALLEPPIPFDQAKLERNLTRMGSLADKAGLPWLVLTPPTHGYLRRASMLPWMAAQYEAESAVYAALEASGHAVSMPMEFTSNPEDMYYRTDHHWTMAGAYQAYLALSGPLGYEPLPLEAFELSEYPGFTGTTLSRSGLPPLWEDTLICAEPESPVTLTILDDGAVYDHLIFPEAAATYDGYAVYLSGNHGMLVIDRPDAPEGTLIVYKDSFANCLLPLLSQHFRQIIAVDARYYSGVFSDALNMAPDAAAVLYAYSLDSLANDTSIVRKVR